MKLAVISDIHGNFPALEAVDASIQSSKIDMVICLGDIVGYGASPEKCLDYIVSNKIPCVLGNHDEAVNLSGNVNNFNPLAREAIQWTLEHITPASKKYLKNLKFSFDLEDVLFVHSSPHESNCWHYLFTENQALLSFKALKHSTCLVGHTHFPVHLFSPDRKKQIINVGSVGQPRDHDNRACWTLFDTKNREFDWIRVEYPIGKAAEQILSAGLPKFLADRLTMGI